MSGPTETFTILLGGDEAKTGVFIPPKVNTGAVEKT